MEKKFESELGKRIVEGKQRKSSKKTILGIAAVCASVLLFGAALTTFAAGVNSPVEIVVKELFEPTVEDLMTLDDVDTDLKRTMSIKYRSTLPPGNGDYSDSGNTKLIYSLNMQVQVEDVSSYGFATIVVGDLSVTFDDPVNAQITVNCAVETLIGTFAYAVPETSSVSGTSVDISAMAQLIVGYTDDPTAEDPTILIPVYYVVAPGDSISWTITVVMSVPNLSGSLSEVAWLDIYEDIANTATF
jgi:hypothetical protein